MFWDRLARVGCFSHRLRAPDDRIFSGKELVRRHALYRQWGLAEMGAAQSKRPPLRVLPLHVVWQRALSMVTVGHWAALIARAARWVSLQRRLFWLLAHRLLVLQSLLYGSRRC